MTTMYCHRPKEIERCNGTQCHYEHTWDDEITAEEKYHRDNIYYKKGFHNGMIEGFSQGSKAYIEHIKICPAISPIIITKEKFIGNK